MITLLLALQLFDAHVTWITVMEMGIGESNPVMASMLEHVGFEGLVFYKVCVTLLVELINNKKLTVYSLILYTCVSLYHIAYYEIWL